mmetsp:Transcript_5956/g.12106  ORF Transcript_5956/g.12106 Transcript_5956/m.12106 type:complete len:129 (+) Transcript_5956:67-453(+)
MAAFASSSKFPPQVHHTCTVNGVDTDIVSTVYSDRVFVHITQIGKFGTFLKAWAEPRSEGGLVYQVSTVMGKRDDPLLHIYARQIIERLSTHMDKPLLLAISLKPDSRDTETFQTILNELFQHNAWNL